MAEALKQWRGTREGAKWQQDRARLPVLSIKQDLLTELQQHDVVVVSGDTGCGKTTQVGTTSHLSARQELLQQHDVGIVSCDTGCGKTAQLGAVGIMWWLSAGKLGVQSLDNYVQQH